MKKSLLLISVFMVAVLLGTLFCSVGCNKETEAPQEKGFVLGIISDPQIVAEADVGDDDYASFQDFNAVGQKMLFLSEAILKTAVDRLIEKRVDAVLIPGDLTENGSKLGHQTVAAQCARLEAAGIPTYVICGNHDINKAPKRYLKTEEAQKQGLTLYEEFEDGSCSVRTEGITPGEFTTLFYEFGFKDAVALDALDAPVQTTVEGRTFQEAGTMSYVQDLAGSNLRLLAIDAANYYEDENENTYYVTYYGSGKNRHADCMGTGYPVMTYRLLHWVEEQLAAAKEAGKTPIAMAHFPVNDQMGEAVGLLTDGIDNRMNLADELLELFAEYGVEYVFTGHLHTQHTATYTHSATGATVTDIETGCLTNYPLPIRFVTIQAGKAGVENEYLTCVKEEYLPAYLNNESVKTRVLTSLQQYALDPFIYDNLLRNFDEKINDGKPYALFYKIFDMLSLNEDEARSSELAALAEYIYDDLYMAFMKMPLYTKDKQSANTWCLEEICQKYGVTLPQSNYTSVFQFFIQLLGKVYKYDYAADGGAITYQSAEGTILRLGVYSIFEILRASDLFPRLHALNANLPEAPFGENFVGKLFTEGKLDLLCDGFLNNVLSVVQPLVEEYLSLDLRKPRTAVASLKLAINLAFITFSAKYPNIVNNKEKSVFGVPITNILTVDITKEDGEDVAIIEININNLLKQLVFEKIGAGLLN